MQSSSRAEEHPGNLDQKADSPATTRRREGEAYSAVASAPDAANRSRALLTESSPRRRGQPHPAAGEDHEPDYEETSSPPAKAPPAVSAAFCATVASAPPLPRGLGAVATAPLAADSAHDHLSSKTHVDPHLRARQSSARAGLLLRAGWHGSSGGNPSRDGCSGRSAFLRGRRGLPLLVGERFTNMRSWFAARERSSEDAAVVFV